MAIQRVQRVTFFYQNAFVSRCSPQESTVSDCKVLVVEQIISNRPAYNTRYVRSLTLVLSPFYAGFYTGFYESRIHPYLVNINSLSTDIYGFHDFSHCPFGALVTSQTLISNGSVTLLKNHIPLLINIDIHIRRCRCWCVTP